MRNRSTAIALVLLASCNRSPSITATNATGAEVAGKIAAAGGTESFIRAGKWSTTVTMDAMTIPGMPPEAAARMKSATSAAHSVEACVTPEEARKPTAEMFNGNSDSCRYDHFTMGGGKIDMVMRCTGKGPEQKVAQVMTMTGSYTPDSYQMVMNSRTDPGTGGAQPMTMSMHLAAKRLGDCDEKKGK